MSNIVSERLNDVYKLLMEGHLTIISDINNDLKCFICKSVLINACQNVCGCIFCERCINNYKRDGGTCCPGDTEECRQDDLSNIMTDHRRNREISRLRVRCDEEGCGYECQLIDLETHLRNCRGKRVNCPFNNIGCEEDKLNFKKMNEHLQMECYSHNNLLIELINNLRNEMRELRENEEKNKCEIIMLKEDRKKDQNEIIILKKEIERLEINLNGRTEEINVLKEAVKVNDEFRNEKEEIYKEMRNTNLQIDELNKWLDTRNTIFTWEIGIIDQLNWIQFSVPFYDRRNLYKMGLILVDFGKLKKLSNENETKKQFNVSATKIENSDGAIGISFVIYPGESDAGLKWPFKANVTVKMVNSCLMIEPKSIAKECSIDRPVNNDSEGDCHYIFYKSKLFEEDKDTMSTIPLRVECTVEMIE